MNTNQTPGGFTPALYDQYLAPLMFAPYAGDLAARLADMRQGRILETAAGTGLVTRALVPALPQSVSIVATDLLQPMLDHAARQLPSPRVTWRQADAQHLPFPDGTFDAVLCQFGAMFFPDQRQAFAEARRVLKPGGRFLFSVWDRITENEFADMVTNALAALFPDDPPVFLTGTPYGHYDAAALQTLLRAAGFDSVTAELVTKEGRAQSAMAVAAGFCQGTPVRGEIEARAPGRLVETTQTVADAIAARFGTGPVRGKIQAHVITAVRQG